MLDVWREIGQDRRVKAFNPVSVSLTIGMALLAVSCEPQAPDLRRVNEIRAKNEKLAMEIQEMERNIGLAGEDTPNLQQDLEAKEKALVNSQQRITALRKREMELKLRQIKLNDRLKKLRASFEQLQSELANTAH